MVSSFKLYQQIKTNEEDYENVAIKILTRKSSCRRVNCANKNVPLSCLVSFVQLSWIKTNPVYLLSTTRHLGRGVVKYFNLPPIKAKNFRVCCVTRLNMSILLFERRIFTFINHFSLLCRGRKTPGNEKEKVAIRGCVNLMLTSVRVGEMSENCCLWRKFAV